MANGDIGIWTDTNGTFSFNNTSWTGVPFNNPIGTPAAIYTQNANDIDIQVSEAGRYLVIYNIVGSNSSHANSRTAYNCRITVGAILGSGTEVDGSLSYGYSRNSNNHGCYLNGFAIVDASADDYIRVDQIRSGSNATANTLVANAASIMIIKLDADWDYFRANKSGIVQGFESESFGDVTWHEIEKDSSFTHTDDTATVTLDAGYYLVMYSLKSTGDASPTRRMGVISRATLEGTAIPQSYSYDYHRGDNATDEVSPNCMFIIKADASNDELKVQIRQEWEGTSEQIDVEANAGLMIVKLPDTAGVLRVWEDTDNVDSGPTSFTTVTFDTNSGTFGEEGDDFSDSSGSITIDNSGDYLFMFGCYSLRNGTSSTRDIFEVAFHVDGSDKTSTVGKAGNYVRGTQSGEDTFTCGVGYAAILDGLSATEVVTLKTRDSPYGQDSGQDEYQADCYGMCALRLDNLFGEAPAVTYTSFKTPVGTYTAWIWNSGQIGVDSGMKALSQTPTEWVWGAFEDSDSVYFPSGDFKSWHWEVCNA